MIWKHFNITCLFLLFQAPPSVAAARLWSGWPLVKQRTIGQPSSWTAQLEKVSKFIGNAHYFLPVSFVEKKLLCLLLTFVLLLLKLKKIFIFAFLFFLSTFFCVMVNDVKVSFSCPFTKTEKINWFERLWISLFFVSKRTLF